MSKMLFISFSKKEEIIQQLPLMKNLRQKDANQAFHLLTFKEMKDIEGLLEGAVDYIHYIDGQKLSSSFNNPTFDASIVGGLEIQEELDLFATKVVSDLKNIAFSEVYNFSLHPAGAHIAGIIPCQKRQGFAVKNGQLINDENRWLAHLKTHFGSGSESVLGYSEVIGKAFKLNNHYMRSSDLLARKRRICLGLWDNDFSDIHFVKQCRELVAELIGVLGTYEVKVIVSPQYRELAMRYFKNSQLLQGQIKEVRECIADSHLVLCGDQISEFIANQTGTPVLMVTKDIQESSVFNDVMSTWILLSGENQNQNNALNEIFEKNVWRLYLDKNSEEKFEIPSPTIAYDFGGANFVSLAKLAKEKQEELEVQRSYLALLKAAFKNLTHVSAKKVYKSDFKELALLAQSILKSKNDPSDYFRGFYLSFRNRYQSSAEGVAQLRDEVSQVEELLSVKQSLIKKVETLSQKGSLYAKGFEFVSEKSAPEYREISGERAQEPEIL